MRLFNTARVALSVVALCALTACGGGGDDSDYPAEGQIVIRSASGTPTGTYKIADSIIYEAYQNTYEGVVLEIAYIEFDQFDADVVFSAADPRKYVIYFEDAADEYVCRSAAIDTEDLATWANEVESLPVCASTLEIDAARHQLRASNFTIRGLENTNNRVTFSASLSWTLDSGPK